MNFRNFILIISLASFRLPVLAQDYQDHTDFKHFPCPNSITGCYENFNNFHGINPHAGAELDNSTVNSALLFGVVGGIVAGGIGENRNYLYGKYPRVMIYLIDYKNGMISPLTRFKLEQILEDDQELLNLYSREEHKSSMMVMHAYLDTFAERHKYK